MDQVTTDVRMAEWTALIQQCQSRPEGQTAKSWLSENGISEKKYYYWLRKVRQQAYNDAVTKPLVASESVMQANQLAYIELPAEENTLSATVITIRTRKATMELSGLSDDLAVRLVKAVGHVI